jgi:Flp pilus assembly pilin Flp
MTRALAFFRSFLNDERAQDAFEYLLIIGIVSVAVVVAVSTPAGGALVTAVVNGVCSAIDATVMTCTMP